MGLRWALASSWQRNPLGSNQILRNHFWYLICSFLPSLPATCSAPSWSSAWRSNPHKNEESLQQIASGSNLHLQWHLPHGSFQFLMSSLILRLSAKHFPSVSGPQSHLEVWGCAEIQLHRQLVWDLDKTHWINGGSCKLFSERLVKKKKNPKFTCRIYSCPQITMMDLLSALPDFLFTAQITLRLLSSDASFVFQPAVKLTSKNWWIKLFNQMANSSLLSLLALLKFKKMPKCHVNYWYLGQENQFS